MTLKPVRVGICGLGTVGGGTFNVLTRNADEIAQADFNADALSESAERDLAQAYLAQREVVVNAMKANDPGRALTALSALAKPLDAFFDQVMVMAEDASVRQNRLALLGELDDLCREVADISCLSLEKSD